MRPARLFALYFGIVSLLSRLSIFAQSHSTLSRAAQHLQHGVRAQAVSDCFHDYGIFRQPRLFRLLPHARRHHGIVFARSQGRARRASGSSLEIGHADAGRACALARAAHRRSGQSPLHVAMCGIAGFATLQPDTTPDSILGRMTDILRHRGPDAHGYYRDAYAALGHRRLSIIDLSAGRQPMANEDGSLWITYNGEIFNHAALRPELERAGHLYRTHADTETILHAYEQYGAGCLARLRGMFAFAIWDKNSRTLFAARDRLGKKPFYYYWDGRLFAFASEIKALFEHPAISPVFEESLLSEYLHFGYTSSDQTLFSGIRKLMPGHYLRLTAAGLAIERYWEIPSSGAPGSRDDESWIRECRERLEETVRLRLMSDVPLGMFLSGGVDSSAIAAIMKRLTDGPVKTFAVGYRESAFSELSYARHVADSIGTQHEETVIGMEDFFNALPRLIWHEDEPITWPSSVSLYFVSKLAARHVKVVLTGEGSDELLGV